MLFVNNRTIRANQITRISSDFRMDVIKNQCRVFSSIFETCKRMIILFLFFFFFFFEIRNCTYVDAGCPINLLSITLKDRGTAT